MPYNGKMGPMQLESLGIDMYGLYQFDTVGLRAHWSHRCSGGVCPSPACTLLQDSTAGVLPREYERNRLVISVRRS